MKRVAAAAFATVLALAAPAVASEKHPTLNELENEIMCPVCDGETLAQSDSPAAREVESVIREKIAAGWTKSQIKALLVRQYGEQILAAPPRRGFNLLAWVLPLVGIGLGAVVLGALAWRWSRAREPAPVLPAGSSNGRALEPDLERRVDEELARFES